MRGAPRWSALLAAATVAAAPACSALVGVTDVETGPGASGGGGGGSPSGGGSSGGATASGGGGSVGDGGACGDGTVEQPEQCDGSVGSTSCAHVVAKPATGTLLCSPHCTFDTTHCSYCGDGKKGPLESCDGPHGLPATCAEAFGGLAPDASGPVTCSPWCQLDVSQCTVSACAGGGGLQSGAWAEAGGCGTRISRTPFVGAGNTIRWSADFEPGNGLYALPVVDADGVAYIADQDDVLHAVRRSGTIKWSHQQSGKILGYALQKNGNLVVTQPTKIHALDAAGGTAWSTDVSQGITDAPTMLDNGDIVFGCSDGMVRSVHSNGSVGPARATDLSTATVVAAVAPDGTLYVFSPDRAGDGGLHALSTGGQATLIGTRPLDGGDTPYVFTVVVAPNGTLYWGAWSDGKVLAYRPDGTLLGSTPVLAGRTNVTALGADGTVYAESGSVYAFDPIVTTDQQARWQFTDPSSYATTMLVGGDGVIYFGTGSGGGAFYALTPQGQVLWSMTLEENANMGGGAMGSDGTLYTATTDGKLWALGAP